MRLLTILLLLASSLSSFSQIIIPDQDYHETNGASFTFGANGNGQRFTCGKTGFLKGITTYLTSYNSSGFCTADDSLGAQLAIYDMTSNSLMGYSDVRYLHNSITPSEVAVYFPVSDELTLTKDQLYGFFVTNVTNTCQDGFGNVFRIQSVLPGGYDDGVMASISGSELMGFDVNFTTYMLPLPGYLNPTVCNSYVSPSGLYQWTESGNYTDTVPSVFGYDSLVVVALTVNYSSLVNQSVTICEGQSLTVGSSVYTESGTYNDLFSSVLTNCDSLVVTELTVDICTGIDSPSSSELRIYPNPSSGVFHISNSSGIKRTLYIYDSLGQLVFATRATATDAVIDLGEQPNGIYFLVVREQEATLHVRLEKF